ncbi:MAG: hypothetical protein M1423_02375 [Acidobacteria bacterium]|nr:hypothetical protein [Acidobacteriota bacterium]
MFGRRMMQAMAFGIAMTVAAGIPAMAGSAAIGSLAGSRDTTLGNQSAVANTTIFSGDTLRVRDGVAVVAMAQGSRMVFGRQTQASFLAEGSGVTVLLADGNVSLYHPAAGRLMQVKAGGVTVSPATGFKTLGEVAMLDRSVVVTAKNGMLQVESQGRTEQVAEGKTVTLPARAARAPVPDPPSSNAHITSASSLGLLGLGAGATGAVLSGIAMSRADNANNAAIAANAAANQAASNASNATSAANAATDAANAAGSTANSVGCALDQLANDLGQPSPYTPTGNYTCP